MLIGWEEYNYFINLSSVISDKYCNFIGLHEECDLNINRTFSEL
jgi:hypothetical protein